MYDGICKNGDIDSETHLGPTSGGVHTHVEYSLIMMGPLREWY